MQDSSVDTSDKPLTYEAFMEIYKKKEDSRQSSFKKRRLGASKTALMEHVRVSDTALFSTRVAVAV